MKCICDKTGVIGEGEIKKGTIAYVDLWKEYFSEKLIFFTPAIADLKIILTFAPQSREIAIKEKRFGSSAG